MNEIKVRSMRTGPAHRTPFPGCRESVRCAFRLDRNFNRGKLISLYVCCLESVQRHKSNRLYPLDTDFMLADPKGGNDPRQFL